jgi:GTP-binding protein
MKEISKEDLSALLHQSLKKHLPSRAKGTRHPYVLRLQQREKNPPVFDLYIKRGASLHSSYLGFLKNTLRSAYGFEGSPIFISIKKV